MLVKKIKSRLKRNFLEKKFSLLKNKTIFSNNCLASFIYQDLKVEYLSPTIGVQIPIIDFCKFCKNVSHYVKQNLIEGDSKDFETVFKNVGGDNINFPCAFLSDIKIMFQHEKTFEEAKEKWARRLLRIKKDTIVIMWVHSFELCPNLINQINSIIFKKIILTDCKKMIENDDWYFLKIPKGKEWWQQDKNGIRYFEKLNWRKILKERITR